MIKPTLVRYIDCLQTVNDLNGKSKYSTFKERCGNVFFIGLLHSSKLRIPLFVCLLK